MLLLFRGNYSAECREALIKRKQKYSLKVLDNSKDDIFLEVVPG
jgi:hypothetical protein